MTKMRYAPLRIDDHIANVIRASVGSNRRRVMTPPDADGFSLARDIVTAVNAYDANQALISELAGALELSRHSIAAAPDDTWGTASAGDDEWPVAAEILAKIDAALTKARAK